MYMNHSSSFKYTLLFSSGNYQTPPHVTKIWTRFLQTAIPVLGVYRGAGAISRTLLAVDQRPQKHITIVCIKLSAKTLTASSTRENRVIKHQTQRTHQTYYRGNSIVGPELTAFFKAKAASDIFFSKKIWLSPGLNTVQAWNGSSPGLQCWHQCKRKKQLKVRCDKKGAS